MTDSILITGASGFVGSCLAEEAAARGFDTWAGIRQTSSRAYLTDKRIRLLVLDFDHPDRLKQQLEQHRQQHGPFGCVVHCAGVTKCLDPAEFERVNYGHTRLLADTLRQLDMVPRQFIFISTLSVFGPAHEADFAPISDADTPRPNTAYGRSKLHAEQYLAGIEGFPYVFLRPTGVYGPRERDYFLMAQSVKRHLDLSAGCSRQDLTFVYVKDVAQAVFLAIERGVTRRAYFLSDGQAYSSRAFADLIRHELGNPFVVHVRCPLPLLKAIAWAGGQWARLTGKPGTLNPDKYRIMKQRNWRCDIGPAVRELGYSPAYSLDRGVRETIAWYKQEKWL